MRNRSCATGHYDVTANAGWVSVSTDHDTAAFAVTTLRRGWQAMGQPIYPDADPLLVCADGGGSNGSRNRLWKVELARFAADTGLAITSPSATCPQAPASGTRSNTACSPTSP